MNSARLPSLNGRAVVRLVYSTDPSRQTTVPVHRGKDIPRGTLRDIIAQAGMTVDEFLAII
jgi:hypothetical protein